MPLVSHRIARSLGGPVDTAADALAIATLALAHPPRFETLAFVVDDARRPAGVLTVVSGTEDPESVIAIAEVMAEACSRARDDSRVDGAGLIVVSVRPDGLIDDDDALRWCRMSDLLEDHGLILLEWFVVGAHGIDCPRDLIGEPERWPRP